MEGEKYARSANPPPKGWAGLYLCRPPNFLGAAMPYTWRVDGQVAGKTSNGNFMYRLVRPGSHSVQWKEWTGFGAQAIIDAKEGENVFLRSNVQMGLVVNTAELISVSTSDGLRLISSLRLVDDVYTQKDFGLEGNEGSISAWWFHSVHGRQVEDTSEASSPPKPRDITVANSVLDLFPDGSQSEVLTGDADHKTNDEESTQSPDPDTGRLGELHSSRLISAELYEDMRKEPEPSHEESETMKKLQDLHDAGFLSDEEYDALRNEPANQ